MKLGELIMKVVEKEGSKLLVCPNVNELDERFNYCHAGRVYAKKGF